ncbi:MAG: hypothetical protein KTR31_02490 [Myxococcales bacterium]|nr:hypothetical protein [Myxococcales bacterium]
MGYDDDPRFLQDDVQGFLTGLGVDHAVALDSGGASMLVIDDQVIVRPDGWREATMPQAVHFQVTR